MITIPRTSDLHGLVVRPVRAVRSTGLALALRELGDVAENLRADHLIITPVELLI